MSTCGSTTCRWVVADANTGSPNLYYVPANHLNTPVRMTDSSKSVVWDAFFLPFGAAESITGSAANNLRFPGQYFLIEDGLHYNWYRHYDPTIGRYLQADPVSGVGAIATATSNSAALALLAGGGISGVSKLAKVGTLPIMLERDIGRELPEFIDGPNDYAYARSAPSIMADPKGLLSGPFTPVPRNWAG